MIDIARLNITPQDLCIFHIGGTGSYGPIDAILDRWPDRCVLVVLEARKESRDSFIFPRVRSMLLNACVGEQTGTTPFYTMKHPEASSIFPPSPEAAGDRIGGYLDRASPVDLWAEEAEVDHATTLDQYSLDDLILHIGLTPEILSLDTQGSELLIIKGMGYWLRSVNMIVTETEFSEIYLGEPLFDQHMAFLRAQGFRLADILNPQYWHPGPSVGQGFLTVGEALWFRSIESFLSINQNNPHIVEQAVNLAVVAMMFDRHSYSYALLNRLIQTKRATMERIEEVSREAACGVLIDLLKVIDAHNEDYRQNKHFFLQGLTVDTQKGVRSMNGPGH